MHIPTRWRTTFEEQLADAGRRLDEAEARLSHDDGGRALQESYPAVVAAATVRIWLERPPWEQSLPPSEMQRQVRAAFPNLYAALSALDIKDVLTSPWPVESARPYVEEARSFLDDTRERFQRCLDQD